MLEHMPIDDEATVVVLQAPLHARTSICLQSNAPGIDKGADVERGVDPVWRVGLEARIEVYQAAGLSLNHATAAALHDMRAADIARHCAMRMAVGTEKGGRLCRLGKRLRSFSFSPPLFANARAATVVSLVLFGLPLFDSLVIRPQGLLLRWWLHSYHLNPDALDVSTPGVNACLLSFGRFELLVVPLLAGLLSGLVACKNTTRGVWNALTMLAVPTILWSGAVEAVAYAAAGSHWPSFSAGEIGVYGIGYWALLGTAGAGLGQWLREKRTGPRSRIESGVSPTGKTGMERAQTRRFFWTPPLLPDAVAATTIAVPLFALGWWADNSKNAIDLWGRLFQEDRWKPLASALLHMVRSSEDAGFYRFELFVIPTLIGVLTGLGTRRNAARGVLNALALLAIPALLLPGMASASQFAGIIPDHISLRWLPNIKPAVNGIAIWGLLGAGAAHTAQWLKRQAGALWTQGASSSSQQ